MNSNDESPSSITLGATREDFNRLTDEDFWGLERLVTATAGSMFGRSSNSDTRHTFGELHDNWHTSDFQLHEIAPSLFLLMYTLLSCRTPGLPVGWPFGSAEQTGEPAVKSSTANEPPSPTRSENLSGRSRILPRDTGTPRRIPSLFSPGPGSVLDGIEHTAVSYARSNPDSPHICIVTNATCA